MTISSEDLELIRKFKAIRDKGYYCDGKQVTDLHNKIFGTRLAPTNCSSCIRQRINALATAAEKFERELQNIQNKAQIQPNEEEKVEEPKDKDAFVKERLAKARQAKKAKKDLVN